MAGGESRRGGRFIVADPLRGVGALGVFVFHAALGAGVSVGLFAHGVWQWGGGFPRHVLESGKLGVYLFFALSGYLLGRPFLEAYIDGLPFPSVPTYLRNRALRLLPAMLAVFVLTLIVLGPLGTGAKHLVAVPLLVQVYFPSHFSSDAVAHYWTLDNEVVFYLLLPLVAWLLTRARNPRATPAVRRNIALAGIAAIAVASLALAETTEASHPGRSEWFPMVAFAFTPGLAMAALSTTAPRWLAQRRDVRLIPPALVGLAVVAFVLYTTGVEHTTSATRDISAGVFGGALVAAALVREWSGAPPWRSLDNRPMHWIGQRSYSFYLVHGLVLRELVVPLHGPGATGLVIDLVVGMLLMVPIVALSYATLERPFLVRRRRWNVLGGPGAAAAMPTPAPPEPPPATTVAVEAATP
jgi:peptidoglycan/LPS O-acetylase OafA/YrhL